ncbi:MAG: hypothetical protein ABEJ73_00875 [Haloplanus sp.]
MFVDYADAGGYASSAAMWQWALTADVAATLAVEVSDGRPLLALGDAVGRNPLDVVSVVRTALTDRQYEMLEAAYRHGYVDRDRNGRRIRPGPSVRRRRCTVRPLPDTPGRPLRDCYVRRDADAGGVSDRAVGLASPQNSSSHRTSS